MKLSSLFDVFKKKNKSNQFGLEYIIICQDSGQPIFTRCWGNICGMLGKKDELLTAFLAAVSTMPGMFAESGSSKLQSMNIGSLKLLFCYTKSENIICLAFQEKDVDNSTMEVINNLFKDISKLLDEDYQETPWDRLNDPKVRSFKKELIGKVIHPWFHVVLQGDGDKHNEDCPICMPMILSSCP